MKSMVKFGIAAALSAVLVVPAMAQYEKPMNISVRAGWFMAQGDGKKAEGQNWFTMGAELKLKDIPSANPDNLAHWSLSIDYYGKGSFANVPVLYNYVGRHPDFYYSVGAGVGFGKRNTPTGTDSSIDFNYQLSVGKDFNFSGNALFAEFRYFGNNRDALAGFSLVGGIRF